MEWLEHTWHLSVAVTQFSGCFIACVWVFWITYIHRSFCQQRLMRIKVTDLHTLSLCPDLWSSQLVHRYYFWQLASQRWRMRSSAEHQDPVQVLLWLVLCFPLQTPPNSNISLMGFMEEISTWKYWHWISEKLYMWHKCWERPFLKCIARLVSWIIFWWWEFFSFLKMNARRTARWSQGKTPKSLSVDGIVTPRCLPAKVAEPPAASWRPGRPAYPDG